MSDAGYSMTQSMRQTQTQILAPHLQQGLKFLQTTSLELAAFLRQEVALNPALEDVGSRTEVVMSAFADEKADTFTADRDLTHAELDFTPEGVAAQNTLGSQDGHLDYFLGNLQSASGDEEAESRRQHFFDSQHATETLQEHLLAQVPFAAWPELKEDRPGKSAPDPVAMAEILIANIKDSGQFDGSYPDIQMTFGATEVQLEAVRRRILKFDPTGCGWRTPQECLLAQLDKLDDSPWQGEVRKLIARHLDDLSHRREDVICADLGITADEFKEVMAAFRTLNPFPGHDRRFVSNAERAAYVRPEIHAVKKEGRWTAVVDERDLPTLRISSRFEKLLEDPQATPETRAYVQERLQKAEALLKAFDMRQTTIRNIAQSIVDAQPGFFERGLAGLRPFTERQVAEQVGVDDSTVSRTVRDKYMTTPFGTFSLRQFFVRGQQTAGGEFLSNAVIKEQLRVIVDAEDKTKPLSDEALSKKLAERGLTVARRTVAKYRDELGIPGTSKRRTGR